MITVAEYNGKINFISNNLQDITSTSLDELNIRRYKNDHVTSINNDLDSEILGTLGGHLFSLDKNLKIINSLYLGQKIRKILSRDEGNMIITSKRYLEVDKNFEIICSYELPSSSSPCEAYYNGNNFLVSFFDKSLYRVKNGEFDKLKSFSNPVYSISSDNEKYYLGFGPTDNGKLMICDENLKIIDEFSCPGYVLSTETYDSEVLVSSEGILKKFNKGKVIKSKKIAKKNITQIVSSENYSLASSRNLLYSIDKNLEVNLVRIFESLVTGVD